MGFACFQGFGSPFKLLAIVLAVLFAVPLFEHAPAQAENDFFSQLFKKRSISGAQDDGAPASNNWSSHGGGNGTRATTATEIVNDGSVSPFLTSGSSAALQAAEAHYAQIVASGGWPQVSGGKLKKGTQNKAVVALNQRLFIEGYLRPEATQGEYASTYTTATEEAVTRFQRNHGLAVTGAVDGATLKELNIPAQRRLATIRANLPRVAEYSRDLGPRYVVVNVPAQQIETISNGTVYSVHNAIVGRPSRPTPVVMTNVAIIKFNPYWNAPASIVERDILPRMRHGGAGRVLRDMNMKVFDGVGGPEVNPDRINWRRAVVDDYHFRQEPGGSNAMATAKIEFDSPFGIYMHDTPEPQLFTTGERFYSSGCVRVEKVAILLNWILNGQEGIDTGRIAGLAESKERLDVPVINPPQLRVAYLTAWPGRNGEVNFRPDVYELDGSGFVMGQPLPVGETSRGERFVLKPVPREASAVDADEAFGFFNFGFGRSRNNDKNHDLLSSREESRDDSLSNRSKLKKAKVVSAPLNWFSVKTNEIRKPLKKTASTAKKPKDGKVAAKKPQKKIVATDTAKKITAKTIETAAADTCKVSADGKLPAGCPPAAVVKPKGKPATATPPATN
jgi:peptidoglycan hydrolase-like protein with peptidoglycan-binding domain